MEMNEKRESLNKQTDYEITSKNEHIKREQTYSLCFVNVLKVQNRSKEFVNKNDINKKKRFLQKATRQNDHYMINMGDQMPKNGGN